MPRYAGLTDCDGELEVDVLVLGCGMAGMTAAFRAADAGRTVLAVDRAPVIGGSALLSSGYVWTAPDVASYLAHCPGADPAIAATMVERFPDVIDWIIGTGVEVGPLIDVFHGRGHAVDIVGYFARATRAVEAQGGWVLPGRVVDALLIDDGAVVGARVRDADAAVDVIAGRTIIATGGFQASRAHLEEHFGPGGRRLTDRSSGRSTGDGLRLAMSVGADVAGPMDAFYGHLVPWPLLEYEPSDFSRLTLAFSESGVLVDPSGHRFVDESVGDHWSAQATYATPGGWACLLFDDWVRRNAAGGARVPGMEQVDRVAEVERAGVPVLVADSLADLAEQLGAWGPTPSAVLEAVESHAEDVRRGSGGPGSRRVRRQPLAEPPFYAIRVHPAITFTLGGIRVDGAARVLDRSGAPIAGLFAAGADVGGAFGRGYAGGLALASVLGHTAAGGLAAI